MCSIALQLISCYGKDCLLSLSISYRLQNDFIVVNYYWPEYIEKAFVKNLSKEELKVMYNIYRMKPMQKERIILENNIPVIIWTYVNEKKDIIKKFMESLITSNEILIHRNDVIKWLRLDIFNNIEFKKLYIMDSAYTTTELCSSDQHTAVTCTMCRSFCILNSEYKYEFRRQTPFMYWLSEKKIIPREMYLNYCRKLQDLRRKNDRSHRRSPYRFTKSPPRRNIFRCKSVV